MQIYAIIIFYKAFDGVIFRVGFFWDRLNVHTFNLESGRLYKAGGFSHRTDRRVNGWWRRDGFEVVITF